MAQQVPQALAVAVDPDSPAAYNNLGNRLKAAGRLDEAIAAYQSALARRPDGAEIHNNLGNARAAQGQFEEAIAAYEAAIALKPGLAEAYNNLGNALHCRDRLDEAAAAYCQAHARQPGYAEAHSNLGNVLRDQGRLDAALDCYRSAIALRPDLLPAVDNLLVNMHFHPDYDARAVLAEHRAWARRFAEPLAGAIRPHANDRTPGRRLKVGILSADLREHPVGQSLVPLLTHHDRRRFELVGFCDLKPSQCDAATEQLRALADAWQPVAGLSDAELAKRIRADRVDILIDLTLHTEGNRMLVFARKPAPVQVTMLGPPVTTGLAAMDYRLTDPYLDPPGAIDGDYTEKSIRLPHCFWCYAPPAAVPPVGALPAAQNGFVTFGCLNQFVKVSPLALNLWIEILARLPGSRLVLQAPPGSHRDTVRARFAERGIANNRIDFVELAPQRADFERLGGLDVSLDPFPFNGHTSTLNSLWMGVPVVTLAGRAAVGRGGVSILTNVGLPELIAGTPEQYVAIALHWASDLPKLAALRAGLRQRMKASPLTDGRQFTADVEAAFGDIWETWCAL
jgi:predicted O-linked N-acetylglucosamine transferase (SPINDLY family)